jgi:hypothetical protein
VIGLDLELFYADLQNSVELRVASVGGFSEDAFAEVAAERLEEANEITNFESCRYRSPNGRLGIDGYSFDAADDSLRTFIVLRGEPGKISPLIKTEADSIFRKLTAFLKEAVTGKIERSLDDNHPARDFAEQFFESRKSIAKIRAYLLSDCQLSARVKDWPEGEIEGIPVEFHIWDIGRFFRAASSDIGLDDVTVDFREGRFGDPEGLPCLAASTPGSPYEAFLCVMPADLLGDIYERYGSRLLEGNVRAFLTAKGKINQGIRSTLMRAPEMFFAYNNGISAIASEALVEKTGSGHRIISATNLQIVNGGQTTASIENVQRNDTQAEVDRAFVPMKLAVVTGEASARMVEDISRYANSQNKVSDADFFANHPFHQRLEQMSRRMWAPPRRGKQYQTHWYYERARGQYLNEFARLTSAQRERLKLEIPKDQLVTKTDLARCELTWQERPYNVSAGAQIVTNEFAKRISEAWKSDADAFSEEYFRNAISRLIVFRTAEKLVSSQTWYVVGFRSIIVTYAIARLAALIDSVKSSVLDLKRIWQEQEVYPELTDMLLVIAEDVAAYLVEEGKARNVTQWVKRQSCWEDIKKSQISMLPQFAATLISADQMQASLRSSRALQQVDSGIDDQTAVANLGSGYWLALLTWAAAKGIVGESDARIIRGAAGVSENFPTDKQSKRLLLVKKRCEDEGFVFARE